MKTKLKHIYWFSFYKLKGASTRYRGYYPSRLLIDEYGINCEFVFPQRDLKGIWKFFKVYLSALFSAKNDSLIIIQKVCSNRTYAKLLKLLVALKPRQTLYDIDDAEYYRQDTRTLTFFLRNCQLISVGSTALEEYCRDFNEEVYILTSPVLDHNERKKGRNKIPNIGWVGDFGNGNTISQAFTHKTSMFKLLFPQLLQIDKAFKLTLIGVKNKSDIPEIRDYFKDKAHIEIRIPENLEWEDDRWVYAEIKKFDIGVYPLTNHPFNISRSAFKAKQYLSVGIPTIASDVGENAKFIKHGVNGFLCQEEGEFKSAIERIIDMSEEKYLEMSQNAFYSKEDFSMRKFCESLIELYNKSRQKEFIKQDAPVLVKQQP